MTAVTVGWLAPWTAPWTSAAPEPGWLSTWPSPWRSTVEVEQLHLDIVAHRGASASAPESTMPALLAGAEIADAVSFDVRLNADGELVVMHDKTLERTTDADTVYPNRDPWTVGDFTGAEIAELDAGSWFDDEWAGTDVPTLAEALDRVPGQLVVEPKGDAALLALLDVDLDPDKVVIVSFRLDTLAEFAAQRPELTVQPLRSAYPTVAELEEWSAFASAAWVPLEHVDTALVDMAATFGLDLYVWGVDSVHHARQVARMGVARISTDVAELMGDLR